MRKRRREYSRRRISRNRDYGGNRFVLWWNNLMARLRRRRVRFSVILIAVGVVLLAVFGGLYLHSEAMERKDGKLAQTFAGQQGGNTQSPGGENRPGTTGTTPPSSGSLVPIVTMEPPVTVTPSPTATPQPTPEVTATPQPTAVPVVTSEPQRPGTTAGPEGTPEPTTNGHEFDDIMVIAVDAGHGGRDGGSTVDGVLEKEINLAVAKEIVRLLEEHGGITVVQTRDSDTFPSLQDRCDIANAAKCDYFVSVHCNTYKADASVRGFECYYNKDSAEGRRFAEAVSNDMKQYTDMKIRSIKPSELAVTRHTYCPAILIEMGFLTNDTDRANLADPDYQKQIAERITKAVLKAAGLS